MSNKIDNFKEELLVLLKKYDDNNFVRKILEKVNNNDIEEQFDYFDDIFHYVIKLNNSKHVIDPNDIYIDIDKDYDKIKLIYKISNSIGNITEVSKIIVLDEPIIKDSLIAVRDSDTVTLQARYVNSSDNQNVSEYEEVKHYS